MTDPAYSAGKEFFYEEEAVAVLLKEGVVYLSDGVDATHRDAAILIVNCNDLFWWGCADGQTLPYDEIQAVYEAFKLGPHAVDRWACLQRKMRPQYGIMRRMQKLGVWDQALEDLPHRDTDQWGNPKIEPK